jgi:hypothetical protein
MQASFVPDRFRTTPRQAPLLGMGQFASLLLPHAARRVWSYLLSTALLALFSVTAAVAGGEMHLDAARDLVSRVDLSRTSYDHGQGTVAWSDPASSYTDCSGFVDHLLMHTYGYTPDDFKRWFDSHRPSAKRYYDAINEQTGFTRIDHITDLRPGDFISVKYLTRTDNTGHIMLVDKAAERLPTSRAEQHGEAWAVTVIDSSESGHGPADTRHKQGDNGKDHDGIGRGIVRIYADRDGRPVGFSWSASAKSAFRSSEEEPIVFGRLVQGYRP